MYRACYLLIPIMVVACGGRSGVVTPEPQVVKCVVATPVEYVSRDFAALSTADDAVTLAFKISGRVADIPVAKGLVVANSIVGMWSFRLLHHARHTTRRSHAWSGHVGY